MNDIFNQAYNTAKEIIETAKLKKGNILVVGCSTSEVIGSKIGTNSSPDTANNLFDGIKKAADEKGVFIAAQCCEHLNRAIIIEAAAVCGDTVNVVPQPKAGVDIGFTMIGMHLKKVAVPVRLQNNKIGEALVLGARCRPKFIGGQRAVYDENLM